MNRFKEYLIAHGEYLGSGCNRSAYKLNDKVYKFSMREDDNEQNAFERYSYSLVPEAFRKFFPNPKWHGRIAEMDEVIIVESSEYMPDNCDGCESDYCGTYCQADPLYYEDGECLSDFYLGQFLINFNMWSMETENEIWEFLQWIENEGGAPEDLVNNPGNFGYNAKTGQLQFVDWGWSDGDWG